MEDRRFQEKDAEVLGISIASGAVQRAFCSSFGGGSYPMLADFHPHGKVSQLYGVYNEERGTSLRSVFVIDKEGVVRIKHIYERGLPGLAEIFGEVETLV